MCVKGGDGLQFWLLTHRCVRRHTPLAAPPLDAPPTLDRLVVLCNQLRKVGVPGHMSGEVAHPGGECTRSTNKAEVCLFSGALCPNNTQGHSRTGTDL